MKHLFILLVLCFSFSCSKKETKAPKETITTIEGKIKNTPNQKLKLAYRYFDGKSYIKDSTVTDSVGKFKFSNVYGKGVYLITYNKVNSYFEIILNNEENINFEVDFKEDKSVDVFVLKSQENRLFYDYINYLNSKKELQKELVNKANKSKSQQELENYKSKLTQLDTDIKTFTNSLINTNKDLLVSKFLLANQKIEIPDCNSSLSKEDCNSFRYKYYKSHYWDNYNLKDSSLVRTPILANKINDYLDNITTKVPDSIIKEVDFLIKSTNNSPNMSKLITIFLLNKYAKSKIMGMDKVYVHIANTYYADEKITPWIDDNQRQKILENTKILEPILIGKTLKNFKFKNANGEEISIYDIKGNNTVLFFSAKFNKGEFLNYKKINKKFKDVNVISILENTMLNFKLVSDNGVENISYFMDTDDFEALKIYLNCKKNEYISYLLDENYTINFKMIDAKQIDEIITRKLK